MKDASWNAEYRRWKGRSVSVWQRRLSITRYGLRLALSGRIMRAFLILSLAQSLILIGVFFFFGQLVAPDSSLIAWLESVGGTQVTRFLNGITSWALLYPEICVDGLYRVMFFLLSYSCPFISVVVVALFAHKLIANDLASQAIVIYSSKALTRWDYIIGKFGVVACILSVIWLLPVTVSWVVGNALAPDWSFFYHSFPSLLRGLALGLVAVVTLSCFTLMVSSLAKKTGTAVVYWILGLLVLDIISDAVGLVSPVLGYIDPFDALESLSNSLYRIPDLISDAQGMLPFFPGLFAGATDNMELEELPLTNGEFLVPIIVLSLLSVASIVVVNKRIRQS
ncbi:ABC transporter permease subunit [Pelagicoccus sp. SDUM812003]|uniref:ABC transporter permease subunit n=1 Tax=Pelagicoccus sp. SDUM812003 TaxID=3041267 RepID=UPI0028101769|nr:ABC transporter permease subunit [Pelagicoccus sp. SDUM812003]MDQ8203094.1 ABC transporter permease subunit [Pelagicoccus sp. SDUM812003]